MLQITVYYMKDGSHFIQKVFDSEKNETLAAFDESTGYIDLSVCEPYIGQNIEVLKISEEPDGQFVIDYQKTTVLEDVGVDENGLKFIRYSIED